MFEEREREEEMNSNGFVGVAVVDINIVVFDERRRNDLRIIAPNPPLLLLLLLKGCCCCCRCRCDWSLSKSVPRCNIYYSILLTLSTKCV